jgi:hypothetical protein
MKLFRMLAIAAVTVLSSLGSATAQWGGQGWDNNSYYGRNGYPHDRWGGGWYGGWRSDPSFGDRRAFQAARRSGRCVVDLGYGRYEYCGW